MGRHPSDNYITTTTEENKMVKKQKPKVKKPAPIHKPLDKSVKKKPKQK